MVVAGLGITGAAAAWEMARRGRRVLAVDAREPPHTTGSSHGRTRIIREAYYEHPLYVPMVQRAYVRWRELEDHSMRRLLVPSSGLHIGPENGELISGVLRSVRDHQLAHALLEPDDVRRRFPALVIPDGDVAVLEPSAGVLLAEACLEACLDAARDHGATLRTGDALEAWDVGPDGITVALRSGRARAAHLVLALGPWLPQFVDLGLEVERQFVVWFEPEGERERLRHGQVPILLREYAPGRFVYAFPDLGDGVKASLHHEGEACRADDVDRTVRPGEVARVRSLLDAMAPGAAGRQLDATVCLYTNTADRHFVIGALEGGRVIIASACSGHGFKFAPVTGELVADLVSGDATRFDLAPFRPERLA